MDEALLLSLGHNSSAIFTDGKETIGYEQERLDGIKASSQFPYEAISAIKKYKNNFKNVFISHWFDTFSSNMSNKYYDRNFLGDKNILSVSKKDFTHHDAHAWSSYSFWKEFNRTVDGDLHYIVADGFGNGQEVISIYKGDASNRPCLIFRVQDYLASMGLMYQFATSFCGMKEGQDEYKFLGYESYRNEVLTMQSIIMLAKLVDEVSEKIFYRTFIKCKNVENITGNLIDYDYLSFVRKYWHAEFEELLKLTLLKPNKHDKDFCERVVIANFIQGVIEKFFSKVISHFSVKNVILSGGVFYNVKLNNYILKSIKGVMSVVPLAGDQGAAIGLYEKNVGHFYWGDLCWGKRELYAIEKFEDIEKNIFMLQEADAVEFISTLLSNDRVVNVVKGNMEFGPRALGNTSTLMLPCADNVNLVNELNNRNEVMPCAPVLLEKYKEYFFKEEQYDRVVGSDKFMIITYDYKSFLESSYNGIMHSYPSKEGYSGRPQVVNEDTFIGKILNNMGDIKAIVNTSFNVHGRPICYDTSSIIQSYMYQRERCSEKDKDKLYLIVVR